MANTSIGIICLTEENKNKPWILFESGALAKGLSSNRVCTFLIDLSPTDLENPLAQFNHTFPIRDSVWELVRTINLSLKEDALKEAILGKVFDTYWPQFEKDFKEILKTTPETEVVTHRNDNEIMLDVLSTVRMLDKRLRNIESIPEKPVAILGKETNASRRNYNNLNSLRAYINSLPIVADSDELTVQHLLQKFDEIPPTVVINEFHKHKIYRQELENDGLIGTTFAG